MSRLINIISKKILDEISSQHNIMRNLAIFDVA